MKTFLVGFALSLIAVPAAAQSSPDSRWSAWLGCWDLVVENASDGAVTPDTARQRPRPRSRDAMQPRVCITPAADGGATFRTTVGSAPALAQTLVPDGTDRPVTENDCTGTQRAEWSRDSLRLFTRADLSCKGDTGARRVSGYAVLGGDATWTDVQAVEIGGRDSYRVRRYRRVETPPSRTDANALGHALTLEDVKEATAKVSPRALEAALVETNASFPMTSRHVLDLDAAKVSPNVIDLIIALSYPKRFVVERTARVDRAPIPIISDPFGLGLGFGYPMWVDGFGLYSPFYSGYSSLYYSPFAYGYNPYFGDTGFSVIDVGHGGAGPQRPSGNARAVDGQGYTRVRPREPEAVASANGAASAGSASSASGSSSSSGSSGGGSVTSQGFSSGGGGGDSGGRTAQPR